jgi:phosphoenolpyruvate-protein phosphotransferase/dihydroxyacetone kinase phosphotransfer subunit
VIGLVIVSHSARLAEGVAELAAQMGGEGLHIGLAGGLDQPGEPLGTDATSVARAIEETWSEDGVLVLMDLGSAVLSAELALDLLPEERRRRVLLTEAPLVEGAVAAAVAAAQGASLETAAAEARGGLAGKMAHLAASPRSGEEHDEHTGEAAAGLSLRLVVKNRLGLHARPAALLVRTAASFDADVTVSNVTGGRGPVGARSLNAVATLGVRRGDEILVHASGRQATDVLVALRRLAENDFGDPSDAAPPGVPQRHARSQPPQERDIPPTASPNAGLEQGREGVLVAGPAARPAPGTVLQGLAASPGTVSGRARWLQVAPVEVPDGPSQDPEADWAALWRALADARGDIGRERVSVASRAGAYEAAILDAHLLFLEDETLLGPARDRIFREKMNAARAWTQTVSAAAATWEALDDPYLRSRVADLRSVGDQVVRRLLGLPSSEASVGAGIMVAPDLTPAQAAALDRSRIAGVVCAFGGPTSHAAVLARALGIPAVVALGPALLDVAEGTLLTMDGEAGTVTVDPPATVLEAAKDRRAASARREARAREGAPLPAVTRDGRVVKVAANVAGPQDIAAALAAGADDVGLLRTEFLFLQTDRMPPENDQESVYREMAEALAGRPLTVRTLDAGADKQLPYLSLPQEPNPSLGLRGIRLALSHPDVLAAQLRAVLRVAADHPVRVMFPMVAVADELRRAREILAEARASLAAACVAVPARIEVGIMVEVPAAALTVEAFTPHVDFFSVGTNDLAQYVLAADRGNARVAALADALHPAVLRLIDRVARAAAATGRWVGVCGEVAGDPLAVPLLLGLGVEELSMAPVRIPGVKLAVRATETTAARRLAGQALEAGSAAEVRELCRLAFPDG